MFGKRSAPKWAVIGALVLLLATKALAAAQSPDVLLPLVTGGQAEQTEPEMIVPPLVEEELDPNAPVGDSQDTHSGDYDVPAEPAAIDAFNATQWTVQNNLGIGTQTPTEPLDIERNVNNYTRLLVRNPHAGTLAQTQLYLNTNSSNGVVLQQFGSGYAATWNGRSLKNIARLRTTSTVAGMILTTGGVAPLILGTADTERMRITSAGRVGIGVSNPAHQLSIAGGPWWTSNQWIGAVDLPNAGAIAWHANADGYSFGMGQSTSGLHFFHTTADPGTTGSAAVYDLTISNYGRVGIGTTSPEANLHVQGAFAGDGVFVNQPGDNGVWVYQPGNDGVIVSQSGGKGVSVFQPDDVGVYVNTPGSFGVQVTCPCGGGLFPNTGVLVNNGNIRVNNGSFIDTDITLAVPDYVFEPEYPLMSLDELRAYVTAEKHLPNVPNEEEIRAGGLDLSDFQMKLLEKTEELTLYTLAQDEQLQSQDEQIKSLQQENEAMQQENLAKDEQLKNQGEQLETMQQMIADLEARLVALEAQAP